MSQAARALLELEHLQHRFGRTAGGVTRAVDDVTLTLGEGETLGLVGESGCGKTTLARCVIRLLAPSAGAVRFDGRDITRAGRRELRPLRREMQMVFQDPYSSLNPRRRIGQSIAAPLRLHGHSREAAERRARDLLERVGLAAEHAGRFPHEFSGGQRQRIGIARALALEPRLIVLDEPVSALDVSVQAQVLNLLDDLQAELGVTYLFVAHDLSVARHVSDRIAVMYLGKVMELAPVDELFAKPIHPYTAGLLAAVPVPDPRRNRARMRPVLEGEPSGAADAPGGCRFRSRCPHASELCARVEPPLTEYASGHLAACHHPLNVTAAEIAGATRSVASPLSAGSETPRSEPREPVASGPTGPDSSAG